MKEAKWGWEQTYNYSVADCGTSVWAEGSNYDNKGITVFTESSLASHNEIGNCGEKEAYFTQTYVGPLINIRAREALNWLDV